MSEIGADIEALHALGEGIRGIGAEIEAVDAAPVLDAATAGAASVATSLGRITSGWTNARRVLAVRVEDLGQLATGTAAALAAADAEGLRGR